MYAYAANNPVKYTDPDGRKSKKVSGGLPYEPELWSYTLQPGDVEKYTNCYAYALNIRGINPITGKQLPRRGDTGFALQLGELAGCRALTRSDLLDENDLLAFIKADSQAAGFTFKETTLDGKVKKGNWKVALVLDPGNDYHWYRLNEDGTWSHKPGEASVTNLDASGNIILDPKTADRDSSDKGGRNYYIFVGYYEVSKCKNTE